MAKYTAKPLYDVRINDSKSVKFDHKGVYETKDDEEVKALDSLCPIYIKREEEPKKAEEPATKRKTSDK